MSGQAKNTQDGLTWNFNERVEQDEKQKEQCEKAEGREPMVVETLVVVMVVTELMMEKQTLIGKQKLLEALKVHLNLAV